MTITGSRALTIVSNHAVLRAVPELLGVVEEFAAANRKWQPKKGCADCNKASFFAPVETNALQALGSLSPDAVARLKAFLGKKELFLNLPQPGRPATVKELK